MNDKNDNELSDAIASEAYLLVMVSCLLCHRDLIARELAIAEPNDPMEKWAVEFSAAAKEFGWIESKTGAVICPICKEDRHQ